MLSLVRPARLVAPASALVLRVRWHRSPKPLRSSPMVYFLVQLPTRREPPQALRRPSFLGFTQEAGHVIDSRTTSHLGTITSGEYLLTTFFLPASPTSFRSEGLSMSRWSRLNQPSAVEAT